MSHYLKEFSGYVLVGIVLMPISYVLIYKEEIPHAYHVPERSFPTEQRQLYVSGITSTMSVSDSANYPI